MGRHPIDQRLDDYRIESLLAEGGIEKLYLALDTTLQRYAAVKVIDVPFRVDAQNAERLRREAQLAAQLRHPHIATVYRFGQKEGRLYVAMEVVDGATLAYVLRGLKEDGEYMSLDEAVRIVGEVGKALDYAHGEGAIHRDIKPGSVVLDRQGHCYVGDFGLATLLQLGATQPIGPSPYYLAEERILSAPDVGAQSDLYALGALLYQMITNTLPSEADSKPLREVRHDVSEELAAVIDKAIAESPVERFQSGAELVAALEKALAAAPMSISGVSATATLLQRVAQGAEELGLPQLPPVTLPPVEIRDVVRRRQRRMKAPLIIAAGVILGLCVAAGALGGLVWFMNRWGPQEADELTAGELIWPFASKTVESTTTRFGVPSPFPSATEFQSIAAETLTPSVSPTAETRTPTMTATETPIETSPTPTAVPPSPTVQPQVVTYNLVVAVTEGEGVFVVNQGPELFPLRPLALDNGLVVGTDWGVLQLSPEDCVVVSSDARDLPVQPDGITCRQVGEVLALVGRERLWRTTFSVIYDGEQVGVCGREQTVCPISFNVTR